MTFDVKKNKKKMEEIAFSDWPGQPVDLNAGNNPWQPAYGFQTPTTLLEKEDFIGNPDAEYFLHGTTGHYMYLETIQEETSDDLRSESDLESRGSPVGWLATDSEAGSVICMETNDDCESDRELACPPKRRKQDCFLVISDDEVQSLSRSSSLLQFETLEKQCQEISNSSPSIYSFDSLEVRNKLSPDSLNNNNDDDDDDDDENLNNNNNNDYYKSLKIDMPLKKDYTISRDSLLYNVTIRYNSDGNSDSSDDTLAASHSLDNLKTWRSYDSLQLHHQHTKQQKPTKSKEKISVENLSEDSGYSDQIIKMKPLKLTKKNCNNSVGFSAYDGDVFNNQFQGNFGVSYQDLSIFDEVNRISPLVDIFMRNKRITNNSTNNIQAVHTKINLPEILKSDSKYNCDSAPNLLYISSVDDHRLVIVDTLNSASVPKDLNLICNQINDDDIKESIAIKNYDITDLIKDYCDTISGDDMAQTYKREGSYSEAMSNRVDLSDDEHSLCYKQQQKKKLPKTTIVEFDKKVLKAISEQSLQSLVNSSTNLSTISIGGGGGENFLTSTPKRDSAVSTPNLALMRPYFDIDRKDSLIKSSTSTSGISDIEDNMKIMTSNINTKGVHFSPVVSEANWPQRDSSSVSTTVTLERESSYNLSSDDLTTPPPTPKLLIKPKCRRAPTPSRARSMSQPDLSDNENSVEQEFMKSLKNLQKNDVMSKSQPDVSRFKRRGSQLIKKDKDGCIIKAYVDGDGIQYKHTHLDINQRQQQQQQHHRSNETVGITSSNPTLVGSRTTFQSNSSITSGGGGGGIITTTNSTSNIEQLQRRHHQFNNNINTNKFVGATMEAFDTTTHHQNLNNSKNSINKQQTNKSSASGKIGGFFSRLASFRFSARKNAEEKNKIKKKNQANNSLTGGGSVQNHQQRIATKDDYIYIPLKSPSSTTTTTNNNLNNGKPPLPKQPPPRIVHVKQKLNLNNNNNALASIGRDVVDDVTMVAAQPPPRHRHHQQQQQQRRRTIDSGQPMEPMGLIETDLDTEVTVITSGPNVKTRSLLNLGCEPHHHLTICGGGGDSGGEQLLTTGHHHQQGQTQQRPHKSMEFLLDKQNLKVVEPPENELQKTERVMSEHQLRVQRSLQKLTVPDWYKQAQIPREGFLLKKQPQRDGNTSRWGGTTTSGGSKTTSLNSLTTSPLILSPTPCGHQQPFVRWSTSKLNSTASSPCASTRSSFNARQPNGTISPLSSSSVRSSFSYRQPYLGWRSQERLTRPRTPAERLASTILAQHAQPQQQPQESPEIQTSIKEVTSAIVHYVSGLRPEEHHHHHQLHNRLAYDNDSQTSQRSLSVSPRGSQKFCWLESSFVGTKPLDSPQTPVTLTESQNSDHEQQQQTATTAATVNLRLDLQTHNDVTLLTTSATTTTSIPTCGTNNKPSPSSTTLEDVLDSLLGLPASGRAPSPSLQVTESANTTPSHQQQQLNCQLRRRRSDTSDTSTISVPPQSRRISLNSTSSSPVLKCRYSRCGKTALVTATEATTFKNCHNCSYTYCSRACRRAHWEKHRKTCLFSRIGTLCRQVIACAKENHDCLQHLSTIARRGCLSHGPGTVKLFYTTPDQAENFLQQSTRTNLGELTYIRWQDLLPSEMGQQMYAELVKMCKLYNTETKFVLYVSICVISETPSTGAVKWERQLVSRCAKIRLSKSSSSDNSSCISNIRRESDRITSPETLILNCPPIVSDVVRTRQQAVSNLQRHLLQYGVLLRKQYPDIYKQLMDYSNNMEIKFKPVTVYPKDTQTGQSFMCIIMLEADNESLRQVQTVGVRIRTVDVLNYTFSSD